MLRSPFSIACALSLSGLAHVTLQSQPASGHLTVASPDVPITDSIGTGDRLSYALAVRGREFLRPSRIGLKLDGGRTLGDRPRVVATTTRHVDQVLRPVVRVKRAEVRDRFNERRIDFAISLDSTAHAMLFRHYRQLYKFPFSIIKVSGDGKPAAGDSGSARLHGIA